MKKLLLRICLELILWTAGLDDMADIAEFIERPRHYIAYLG